VGPKISRVRKIWPEASGELDDAGLAVAYAFPRAGWLRVNFVTSADGGASVDGRSDGLSSDGDKRIFGVLRVLADVVIVGSGTARAEKYKPAKPASPALAEFRGERPATPPIALVTKTVGLDLASELFTQAPADARTIVITCAAAPAENRARAAEVADVIVAGEDEVDLAGALKALADRGLSRVLCEGGPHLFGDLAAAGLVDELCLTLSPTLAGPGPGRIIAGSTLDAALSMRLGHLLTTDDSFLYGSYVDAKAG
jgi:riboflavin biosynthesis pyrimidine reductase